MRFDEYVIACEKRATETAERRGQSYFNLLCEECPGVADEVVDTAVDPFNDDARISDFLEYVIQRWDAT